MLDLRTSALPAVLAAGEAVPGLLADEPVREIAARAAERGHFHPEESARLRAWFAQALTVRGALLRTVVELRPLALGRIRASERETAEAFLVGMAAACALVHLARFIVFDLATDAVVQRKLNEPSAEHRYGRKEWTKLWRGLTHPRNVWRLVEARRTLRAVRGDLERLAADPELVPAWTLLTAHEPALDVGYRTVARARLLYRWHAWRRRHASAYQQALFGLAEASGRVIADLRWPWHRPCLRPRRRRRLAALLRPGDVLVTRHADAVSNLFLPGYWPHAALHVGPRADAERVGVAIPPHVAERWTEPLRVLEARKDGVRLRVLEDTLAVDAVIVLRPRLDERDVARALAQALVHEGKAYNFDFDFFTDDRLVCTEVIYRAYQGVAGIDIPLLRRAGRPTLSAEDLVDIARRGEWLEVAYEFRPGLGRGA